MNYYEINKECIRVYKPLLYKSLYEERKESVSTMETTDAIEIIEAKDGTPVLKVIVEGKNHRLNSIYHPEEEARRWTEQYHFGNPQTVMSMFGLGNGIFTKNILKNLREDGLLLVYEPTMEIFNYVLQHYDLTFFFRQKNAHVYIQGVNEEFFSIHLKTELHLANYKNLLCCHHPQYNHMFPNSYETYLKMVKDSQRFVKVNINTGNYFAQRQIENILENTKFLKDSISLYDLKKYIPNHVPAVVIAAGPSAENSIKYLKEMKGKAVLFAVDRILDILLDYGIEPDFVVSIDAKKSIEYFSRRTDITVPLICYGESNYEILNHHQGKKILATQNSFTGQFYKCAGKPIPHLNPSGSVAIVAFHVCVALGFNRVILVGQDLAYDGDKSHSGNVRENNTFQNDLLVEGIGGEMVLSRTDWRNFISMYQDSILSSPHVEVIDVKLKGAKIPGTINMELKETIKKYCTEEITLTKKDIEHIIGFTETEWEVVSEYISNMSKELLLIQEKANKGITVCKELISLYNKRKIDYSRVDKYIKKLKNINQDINEYPLYNLLDKNILSIAAEELSEVNQFSDNELENEIKVIERAKIVYDSTLKTVEYVEPLLDRTIKSILKHS